MNTPFDEWLRQLKLGNKGPVRLSLVTRGRKWEQSVSLVGDYTGATMRGEVRVSPDAVGSAEAEFTVTGPVVAGGYSTFTLSLSTVETEALPSDGDADGVEFLPYDLLLTPSGGDEELLFGGVLPLIGRITE